MRFVSVPSIARFLIFNILQTTAHTLCFTLALLALFPDEQEILFQHIKSVLSDGRTPVYYYLFKEVEQDAYLFNVHSNIRICRF